MRIAAALHTQPRGRAARQIARHDRRAPAVERERRNDHPPVPDRYELGHARRVLFLKDADRVRTVIGRRPLAESVQRHRLALNTPLGQALLDCLRNVQQAAPAFLIAPGFLRLLALRCRVRHPTTLPAPEDAVDPADVREGACTSGTETTVSGACLRWLWARRVRPGPFPARGRAHEAAMLRPSRR